MTDAHSDQRRHLPSVRALIESAALTGARTRYSHEAIAEAARTALARAREAIGRGEPGEVTPGDVIKVLEKTVKPRLRRVINATGVVLHTNLGRSPLAEQALAALQEAAGYTNLELRLDSGERGGRDDGVNDHIGALTGAERAFAVNNCAAATLLALTSVAAGKEVIVSRGELVEIGGGFRVPEVLQQSGCRLVEVGTTNRTRASDYERAFTEHTAAVLRVHRSNFALVGFTEDVPIDRLAALAHERRVPLLFDQGTGELDVAAQALREGCDLVTFSGDKLLGGPQAGILAGRTDLIDAARRHPLARALRLDKLTLAALEATLALWRTGQGQAIPAARMLTESVDALEVRAGQLQRLVDAGEVTRCEAAAGGGTHPGEKIDSYALRLRVEKPDALSRALRLGEPPVMARVADGALLADVRTVAPEEIPALAQAIRAALVAVR